MNFGYNQFKKIIFFTFNENYFWIDEEIQLFVLEFITTKDMT